MANAESLITDHLDLWSSSVKAKKSVGRGSSKKRELYGVKKLRGLILELAVRGLLVPQDPKDEPAPELLNRIKAEKARLLKEKKIKKSKVHPKPEEKYQFKISDSWVWTQLGEITEIGPRNSLEDKTSAGFVPMPKITTTYNGDHGHETKDWSEIKKGYTHFANGDIALAKITPCFENSKAAVFRDLPNGLGAGTTELHVARPFGDFLDAQYILLYLKSPFFLETGKGKMTGSAGQKRVPSTYFSGHPLPLPPLAEQHRIVAKVDELMALCDQLEQQQEDSVDTHETLVKTLLDALTTTSDPAQFQQAWQRIEANFHLLFTTESSIDHLKQTILQLAVMGKLVPQDPNDEPASELLKKIAAEKEQLIKERKIKRQKALPPISEEEKPFIEPAGWEFIRLDSITSKLGSGSTPRGGKSAYVNKGIIFLRSQNVWNDGLRLDDTAYIPEETHANMSNTHVLPNDVLLNITGASLGRSVIFPKELKQANVSQHVTIIRLIMPEMCRFLHLGILSPLVQKLVWGRQVGMAIEGLSKKVLEKFEFPIPPLAEQHRIVAKVDELMTLCDTLKAKLQSAQTTQQTLTDTIVEQATN